MRFTDEQLKFAAINGVQLHDMMNGNEIEYALDVMADLLQTHGIGKDCEVNEFGLFCEGIIDKLSEL